MVSESTAPSSHLFQQDFVDRAETAVQKVRDVVRGNGLHPVADIELLSYEEIQVEFEAKLVLTPHYERGEKLIDRPAPGAVKVRREAERDSLIARDMQTAFSGQASLLNLKENILKRPDKGFFADKQRFPVAAEPLKYMREESCIECKGQKTHECKECRGRGYEICQDCKGKNSQSCKRCQGKGETNCHKCQRKGRTDCHKCKSHGVLLYLSEVKLFADSHFSYDKESIPSIALPVIERLREKLLTKEHASYDVSDDIDLAQKEQAESVMSMTYHVSFPLGDAKFRVGDEEVPALLFGYKSALLDVPPFLERYMLGPFNLLREAAAGQGNVAGKTKKAAYETRFSNEVVMGVAQRGAGATAKRLKHEYSIALEPQFIDNIVKAARGAMNTLTSKPQMAGLAIGLIPSLLLAMIYIFLMQSGGAGTDLPIRILLDLVFLGICSFVPYLGAQLFTRQSLIYALGERAIQHIKLPALGARGYAGPLTAASIFIFFAEIAYKNNPETAPQIYSLLRQFIG